MSAVARYTKQVVILTTPERGAWIKEQKKRYGVSEAQVARDCIELGAELLAQHYALLGIKHPGKAAKAKKRTVRRKQVDAATGAAPAATFLSPSAV